MRFILLRSYDNYIYAHIAMGRLEEDNVRCWLKDENTVTIDPILTNAVGGIKLMVEAGQAERANSILLSLQNEYKARHSCPQCGSKNIEEVSTPRKVSNWASAIIGFLFTSYAPKVEMVHHCFDCGHEYPVEDKIENSAKE